MSRLIVKNLPKNITEERVKTIFAEMGQITDLKLKYTKNGVFRRFAFIGFKTHTEAERALKHFHNTFIDTSKLQVDICKDLGDETAPRPWSKYSEKSSAFQKKVQKADERKRTLEGKMDEEKLGKVVKKKKIASALLGDLENDSSFQEFLDVHKSGIKKNIWSNDEQLEVKVKNKKKPVYSKVGNSDGRFQSGLDPAAFNAPSVRFFRCAFLKVVIGMSVYAWGNGRQHYGFLKVSGWIYKTNESDMEQENNIEMCHFH